MTLLHDWLGLAVVALSLVHVLMHTRWLVSMTRKMWVSHRSLLIGLFSAVFILAGVMAAIVSIRPSQPRNFSIENEVDRGEEIIPETDTGPPLSSTLPMERGQVTIQGIGTFNFDPADIQSVRNDVFNEGYFSLFDILVHLHQNGHIEMDYVFDERLDTHLIRSINGAANWWYTAYYDGGWPEKNVWRMDLYPYKERTFFQLRQVEESLLTSIHKTFSDEVVRLVANNETLVIPEVSIRGQTFSQVFKDVAVSPHHLRTDYFSDNTVTAIDVILSLSERGLITHQLNWYESIGSTGIVKNYFVDAINEDVAFNRCGFVYEVGSADFKGFKGNHIHIPADLRILTSPDYVEFFWICI